MSDDVFEPLDHDLLTLEENFEEAHEELDELCQNTAVASEPDSMRLYLQEIGATPLLKPEEELYFADWFVKAIKMLPRK